VLLVAVGDEAVGAEVGLKEDGASGFVTARPDCLVPA
jgi:hypothetical protein